MARVVTTGVTFYDWGGVPAMILDGRALVAPGRGAGWMEASAAAVRASGLSIGRDEFDARFSGWGLADLADWYQSRDPSRTLSWRDIRRS